MRILQICHKIPYPTYDGGSIAMHRITHGLLQLGCQVKVLALETPAHPIPENPVDPTYLQNTRRETVFIDTRVSLHKALLNLFSSRSYNIERFDTRAFHQKVQQILSQENFDGIILEGLYTSPALPFIRQFSQAPVILRSHNIEHHIWERMARSSKRFDQKWYLKLLAKRLKTYELKTFEEVDGIAAITPLDQQYILKHTNSRPVISIPVGLDYLPQHDAATQEEPFSVASLASMDWLPNQEGIHWFLSQVWPRVHTSNAQIKLYLAGRKMPEWLKNFQSPQLTIVGEVPDAEAFLKTKALIIVPLLSGGGMRVKILEAMSLGKAVLATPVGAEGIECSHDQNILIANDAQSFATQILQVFQTPDRLTEIGMQAQKSIFQTYNNQKITAELLDLIRELQQKTANNFNTFAATNTEIVKPF